ncbi:hypothetical protein FKM82_013712 [Ascaphus truei]
MFAVHLRQLHKSTDTSPAILSLISTSPELSLTLQGGILRFNPALPDWREHIAAPGRHDVHWSSQGPAYWGQSQPDERNPNRLPAPVPDATY